jgi:Glycosyltransferases involved in cell wall biogenesis
MLSILVPCFNEENIIYENINKLLSWSTEQNFESEIIVINNGSTDKTESELRKFEEKDTVLILNEKLKGKGFAIKRGLENCKYNKAVILDADLSADINELKTEWLEADNLLIIGSRPLGNEINTPLIRKFSGIVLNFIIRKIFNLDYLDTQCGFKFLSTDKIDEIYKWF